MNAGPAFDPKRSAALRSLLIETVATDARRTRRFRWPTRKRTSALLVAGVIVGLVGTGGAAWALSNQTLFFTPSSTPGGQATLGAVPDWPVNERGETYGVQGNSATAPDLILVVATNGLEGYAYSAEMEAAEGTGFTSPEEALAWQEANKGKHWDVPVYESDGVTEIGTFRIG